jgi:hypothetical protein
VSIQRWNLRRVGLALVAALGLVLVPLAVGWTARTDDRMDNSLFTRDVSYSSREPLWLMAQSVPEAALVPCVQLLPAGWTLADVRVRKGLSQLTFDTDRAGKRAVVVELTGSVDLAGAVEVTSEQLGARRYVLVDRDAQRPSSTRVYVFDGGAVAIRFTAPTPQQQQQLASEASSAIGFTTREQLRQALSQRTDGRLHLDP